MSVFNMCVHFCLLFVSIKLNCALVDLMDANKLKNIVNSTKWMVEIDREIYQSLKSVFGMFPFGIFAKYALLMINKFFLVKWRFCQFAEIFLVDKQEVLSRCRMISLHSLVQTNGTLVGSNFYVLQVPNTFGINFSVTEFISVHTGECFYQFLFLYQSLKNCVFVLSTGM